MASFPRLLVASSCAASVLLALCSPVSAQQCGDVDCNAKITATDALRVLKKAVGLPVTLICDGDCPATTTTTTSSTSTTSSSTTTLPPTTTTLPATTTTTAGPTTTTTLPQDRPCLCGADCPFVCPDQTFTTGACVIEQAGLAPGECRCTAICSGVPQVCPATCDQSACTVQCPDGGSVPGECSVDTFAGCLCTNVGTVPCP